MKNYARTVFLHSVSYPFVMVLIMWLVFFLEQGSDRSFVHWGILPRKWEGLPGIVCSVFIHGDLGHITSNTLPLLVLGTLHFYFYRKIAKVGFLLIWLVSGFWLWIGGRNNELHPQYHIGASTLVYGLAFFLFFSGVFRRHIPLMVVSALVVFLYGSLVWGMLPIQSGVSWEGHLFGALAGVLVAFSFRKEGPRKKKYSWEDEKEEELPGQATNSEFSEEPGRE